MRLTTHLDQCETCESAIVEIEASVHRTMSRLCDRQDDDYTDEIACQRAIQQISEIPQQESAVDAIAESRAAVDDHISKQFGSYQLLARLGEGGMGVVYKARHRNLNKLVALKILPRHYLTEPAAIARFQREMQAVGMLEHENIVRATDAGEVDGIHFLVLELVDGINLSALTRLLERLPVADACELVRQASCGLQFAHDCGIVHRDMKPANLMLTRQGQVKILDMGLALLARNHHGVDVEITESRQVLGTLDYMAPEQCGDSHRVDARVDIYALGATLYKLLCGNAPFSGPQYNTTIKKVMAVANEPLPSIREKRADLPDELVNVLEKMMAKDPEDRYETAQQVAKALLPFTKDSSLRDLVEGQAVSDWLDKTALHVEFPTASIASSVFADTSPPETRRPKKSLFQPARLGIGLAGIAALVVVFYLATNNGQLVVESELDDIRIVIKRGDEVIDGFQVSKDGKSTKLRSGHYTIELPDADPTETTLDRDEVTLSRGKTEIVRITRRTTRASQGDAPPLAIAPFDTAAAKKHQQAWANYLGVPVEREIDLPGGEKLTMVLIPPGEFMMGMSELEQARYLLYEKEVGNGWATERLFNTGPQHRVRITQPFYLGKYEVTQAQWEAVMGNNPSAFNDEPNRPVEQVSWNDIQKFLRKWNEESEKHTVAFFLPTEAQWEYACRAGTISLWHSGDSDNTLREYAWFEPSRHGGRTTHPVGQLKPNAWRLHDMHGNVWEWCADRYAENYYAQSPLNDPGGPLTGSNRVDRGGGWKGTSAASAFRDYPPPNYRADGLGFRLAIAVANKKKAAPSIGKITPADDWVDLLPTIHLPSDALRGQFALENGRLRVAGSGGAILKVPVQIHGSYRLRVAFESIRSETDSHHLIAMILPTGKSRVLLTFSRQYRNEEKADKMGGNRAALNLVKGANKDGRLMGKQLPASVFDRTHHQSFVTVSLESETVTITATLNGVEGLTWTGNADDLSVPGAWADVPEGVLGLSSGEDKWIIHDLDLQMLDGEAKLLRPVTATDLPVAKPTSQAHAPAPAIAPFDAATAKKHQQAWADYLGVPVERDVELPGSEKLTMMLIPPGEFMMGSSPQEQAYFLRRANESSSVVLQRMIPTEVPQHPVRITQPFYLGKFEVTQAQWQAVMGSNPSKLNDDPQRPVEQLSWDDIQPMLWKLNETLQDEGLAFVLPTEAQWEYACRAGTTTPWYFGDSEKELFSHSWTGKNSDHKSHPVGQLLPNPYGLHDMYGNVSEWCADFWDKDYYANSPVNDPRGPLTGTNHVTRGECWFGAPGRSARRGTNRLRYPWFGFRLAAVFNADNKAAATEPAAAKTK